MRHAAHEQHHGAVGGNAVARTERGSIAARELLEIEPGRYDVHRSFDAVTYQHVGELPRRSNHGIHGIALSQGSAARKSTRHRARQQRHVVMQIFLEERVIRLEHRHAQLTRNLLADPVRDERCLDVHDVDAPAEREPCSQRGAPMQHSVFRIEDQIAGRLPQYPGVVLPCLGIAWRNQPRLAVQCREVASEGLNRGRDAVDAGEVDVRDEQDPHDHSRFRDEGQNARRLLRQRDGPRFGTP